MATAPPLAGGANVNTAVLPVTLTVRPVGAPGGGPTLGTVICTWFDSGLGPDGVGGDDAQVKDAVRRDDRERGDVAQREGGDRRSGRRQPHDQRVPGGRAAGARRPRHVHLVAADGHGEAGGRAGRAGTTGRRQCQPRVVDVDQRRRNAGERLGDRECRYRRAPPESAPESRPATACLRIAQAPATCGVAIEVPSKWRESAAGHRGVDVHSRREQIDGRGVVAEYRNVGQAWSGAGRAQRRARADALGGGADGDGASRCTPGRRWRRRTTSLPDAMTEAIPTDSRLSMAALVAGVGAVAAGASENSPPPRLMFTAAIWLTAGVLQRQHALQAADDVGREAPIGHGRPRRRGTAASNLREHLDGVNRWRRAPRR